MNILVNEETVFSEEWGKQCFLKENIPNNSFFLSHFFDEKKQPNICFYLKFDNSFYCFEGKSNKLIKMNDDHEFNKINSLNEIKANNVTLEDIDDFWGKYTKLFQIESEIKANSYKLSEEDQKAFLANKISVMVVSGATGYDKKSSAIYYDDVQYCIKFYGNNYLEKKQSISHNLSKFKKIKESYHSLIKEVYNYLINELKTHEIFVIPSGGTRTEAIFSYAGGYIATISLDMDISEKNIDKSKEVFNMKINKQNCFFKNFKNKKLNIIY